MPRFSLKRREPLVKFFRRAARGHLEAADTALRAGAAGGKRAPAQVAKARRELLRLRALLQLMRGPMGGAAYGREHGAVQRLVRRIGPHALDPHADAAAAVRAGGSKKRPRPAVASKPGAGPALLRALADLADVRVRSGHWHVPEAGFDALAPALRSAWRQAARPVGQDRDGSRAAKPAARAEAALTLHDQLRCIQRVWPAAIDAPRLLARELASHAARLAALTAEPADASAAGSADAASRKRLADAQTQAAADLNAAATRLRAEAPAAFTRRVGAYWALWRCVKH